jgi:hypothetical protein
MLNEVEVKICQIYAIQTLSVYQIPTFVGRRNVISALNTIEYNFHNILNVNEQYF